MSAMTVTVREADEARARLEAQGKTATPAAITAEVIRERDEAGRGRSR